MFWTKLLHDSRLPRGMMIVGAQSEWPGAALPGHAHPQLLLLLGGLLPRAAHHALMCDSAVVRTLQAPAKLCLQRCSWPQRL